MRKIIFKFFSLGARQQAKSVKMFFSNDRYVFAECPYLKAESSKIKFYFALLLINTKAQRKHREDCFWADYGVSFVLFFET